MRAGRTPLKNFICPDLGRIDEVRMIQRRRGGHANGADLDRVIKNIAGGVVINRTAGGVDVNTGGIGTAAAGGFSLEIGAGPEHIAAIKIQALDFPIRDAVKEVC